MPGRMTAPRLLINGATYLITRRCLRRKFLLRPGKLANRIFGYLLARAASRSGIRVHVFCFMSNHLHLVVTDPHSNLPRFTQYLDGLIARAINALYGLEQAFWDSESYSAVALAAPEDVLDKCAYVLANPVAAGLVPRGRKWPGLWSSPAEVGRTLEFERPAHFFRRGSYLPESIGLRLAVPRGFESEEAFRAQLEAELAVREERAAIGRTRFVGVARVLKLRVLDRPASRERRRALRPRFAAKCPKRRDALARRLKTFLAEYREALRSWREGDRAVVFPEGTYHMRVAHLVACAGAG